MNPTPHGIGPRTNAANALLDRILGRPVNVVQVNEVNQQLAAPPEQLTMAQLTELGSRLTDQVQAMLANPVSAEVIEAEAYVEETALELVEVPPDTGHSTGADDWD